MMCSDPTNGTSQWRRADHAATSFRSQEVAVASRLPCWKILICRLSVFFWWFLLTGIDAELVGQIHKPSSPITALKEGVVKIFGSGGLRGLEAYQSGLLITENGYILTVWSPVLDSSRLRVVLHDGRSYASTVHQYDSRSELAVLKIEDQDLPCFDLSQVVKPVPGETVYVGSNLFGIATGEESITVMKGVLAAIAPLDARRGSFEIAYRQSVLILDAITSNPGAAGGAIVDGRGNLLGMIGKEAQCARTGTWLNYGYFLEEIRGDVAELLERRSRPSAMGRQPNEHWTCTMLGIQLIPAVVPRTPPFINRLDPHGVAAEVGLATDDLIVEVNGTTIATIEDFQRVIREIGRDVPLRLTVQRGGEFKTFLISGR